uniref:Uncharacterized protein n=1 Tax=Rhizophora mucronata TaxID=61149 RepID=A0A2P2KBL1_RHIMU
MLFLFFDVRTNLSSRLSMDPL